MKRKHGNVEGLIHAVWDEENKNTGLTKFCRI